MTKDEQSYVPADFTCRPFASGLATERTLPLNINATNQVGTLILPFSAELPQGVKAYTCDALNEEASELVLTPAASLQACTPYCTETFKVKQLADSMNIPYLAVETDYSQSDSGQLSTRLEAFLEML